MANHGPPSSTFFILAPHNFGYTEPLHLINKALSNGAHFLQKIRNNNKKKIIYFSPRTKKQRENLPNRNVTYHSLVKRDCADFSFLYIRYDKTYEKYITDSNILMLNKTPKFLHSPL